MNTIFVTSLITTEPYWLPPVAYISCVIPGLKWNILNANVSTGQNREKRNPMSVLTAVSPIHFVYLTFEGSGKECSII